MSTEQALAEVSTERIPLGSYTEVENNTDGILCIKYGANIGVIDAILDGFKDFSGVINKLAPEIGVGYIVKFTAEAAKALVSKYGAPHTTVTEAAVNEAVAGALKKGLRRVNPGGKYRSDKLTLSLVHQANVVLVLPADKATSTFTVYSGSFTVWSGATLNSTKKYHLSAHLGHLKKEIIKIEVHG